MVLLSEKVRLVVPFSGTVGPPNAFAIVGGLMTVKFALEVDCGPVPAAAELIVTLLLKTLSTVPITFTVIVQAPTARFALVKVTLVAAATGEKVPPQVFVAAGGFATTMLAGNVSVKFASTAITFGLLTANVSVEGAFTATVVGLKLLVI